MGNRNIELPIKIYEVDWLKEKADKPEKKELLPDNYGLAILPFKSSTPKERDFVEDLFEELYLKAVKLKNILVASSTLIHSLQVENEKLLKRLDEQHIKYLLEGKVSIKGDTVKVTIQLSDTGTGFILRAEKWEFPYTDSFKDHKSASDKIINCIKIALKKK